MKYSIIPFKLVQEGTVFRFKRKWLRKHVNNMCTNTDPLINAIHIVLDRDLVGVKSNGESK